MSNTDSLYSYQAGEIQQPRFVIRMIDGNEYICRHVTQDEIPRLQKANQEIGSGLLNVTLKALAFCVIVFIFFRFIADTNYSDTPGALFVSMYVFIVVYAFALLIRHEKNKRIRVDTVDIQEMAEQDVPIALTTQPKIDVRLNVKNDYYMR